MNQWKTPYFGINNTWIDFVTELCCNAIIQFYFSLSESLLRLLISNLLSVQHKMCSAQVIQVKHHVELVHYGRLSIVQPTY